MSKPLLSSIDIPPSSPPTAELADCFALDFLALRAEKKKNTGVSRRPSHGVAAAHTAAIQIHAALASLPASLAASASSCRDRSMSSTLRPTHKHSGSLREVRAHFTPVESSQLLLKPARTITARDFS